MPGRIFILLLTSALCLTGAQAFSAPTPTPKPKISVDSSVSKKPVVKKPVVKKPVVKKPAVKKKKKKKKKLSPSPSPMWPPAGFKHDVTVPDVYAKVPTKKELVGIASAKSGVAQDLKQCVNFTCGVIQVASISGCLWWEVQAKVWGPISESESGEKILGSIKATFGQTEPQKIETLVLVTGENLGPRRVVKGYDIQCNREAPSVQVPSSTYTPVAPVNSN